VPSNSPETLSRQTRFPFSAQGYDSRTSTSPGIGFPSCCTDLVPAPANTADPHDYYAELGVDPGASDVEIRHAVRHLYRDLHPDTGSDPDPERLTLIANIAEVLLDPAARIKYNNTPPGHRLIDKVYREQLSKLDARTVRAVVETQTQTATSGRFDYFALGYRTTDTLKAQQWYHYLLANISATSFRGQLRLLLWDGERPAWAVSQGVLMVPRGWEPSDFTAIQLLSRVIGKPVISNISQTPPPIPTALSQT
jgi:hypothetical protein